MVLEAVLPLLNKFARIPLCGLIAHYDEVAKTKSVYSLSASMRLFLIKSITLRGFINFDFEKEYYADFISEIAPEVNSGRIKYKEDIVDGLENTPRAFIANAKWR